MAILLIIGALGGVLAWTAGPSTGLLIAGNAYLPQNLDSRVTSKAAVLGLIAWNRPASTQRSYTCVQAAPTTSMAALVPSRSCQYDSKPG